MSRRVCLYLFGGLLLVALAGCGGGWFMQQREPWRHDAEVACLKSGQVKISPAVAQLPTISGPGMCGADFPLKVAALGESSALGFADELRPPGTIPGYSMPRPIAAPRYEPYPQASDPYGQQPYGQQPYGQPPYGQEPSAQSPYPQSSYPPSPYPQSPYASGARAAAPGAPLSLKPPGAEADEEDEALPPPAPGYGRPYVSQAAPLPDPGHAPPPYAAREGPYDPSPRQPPVPYYTPPPHPYGAAPYGSQAGRGPYGAQPAGEPYGSDVPQGAEPLPPLGPPSQTLAGGSAAVVPPATLACPMVSALDQWIAGSVQPAATRWFGQPVVEIKQISAYSCRGMNGNPHAHISEHAFGNALDVAAFTLADGRKVTVKDGWRGLPEERGFLHDVHAAACEQFTTVLGPGSNVYHYNHLHLDLMRRSSGRSICNPAAVPGDRVAGRRADPLVTGSITTSRSPLGFAPEDARERALPAAIAGED